MEFWIFKKFFDPVLSCGVCYYATIMAGAVFPKAHLHGLERLSLYLSDPRIPRGHLLHCTRMAGGSEAAGDTQPLAGAL